MRWPTSLIVGGLQYGGGGSASDDSAQGGTIEKAEALESVLRISGCGNGFLLLLHVGVEFCWGILRPERVLAN